MAEARETISVTMTAAAMRSIREAVASGKFATPAEVLEDAVRVWGLRHQDEAETLDVIRKRVRRSLEDPRPSLSSDEAAARLDRFMDARSRKSRHAAD